MCTRLDAFCLMIDIRDSVLWLEEEFNGEFLVVNVPELFLVRVVQLISRYEESVLFDKRRVKREKEGAVVVMLWHFL